MDDTNWKTLFISLMDELEELEESLDNDKLTSLVEVYDMAALTIVMEETE